MGHGDDKETTSKTSYPIAWFDFNHVSIPLIVTAWVVIVGYIKTLFHISEKTSKLIPESCLLVVLGIAIGGVAFAAGADIEHGYIHLSSELFFIYLLPPIVFEAGYFMPTRPFFENLGTILLYALVGTLWNTISIGLVLFFGDRMLWYNEEFNILKCFLFSALISAVDPVAVLAVFEEVHVNQVLYILVFGESLLNDAVTVVLYHMMENFSYIGEDNLEVIHFASAIANFFCVSLGGILIGIIYAVLGAVTSKYTSHVQTLEPIFVFATGYLAYLSAELFHFSGILAIVSCGMFMGQYVESNIAHKSHTTVKYFLKMMASVSEAIIFLFLGLSTISKLRNVDVGFVCVTLVACFVCRFIGTYGLTFLANFRRKHKMDFAQQFIMAYGGIRGAVAFCLAASLGPDLVTQSQKDTMETTCLIVIFFTVFIQGITIKPLVKLFQIKTLSRHDKNLMEILSLRVVDHAMGGMEDIVGFKGDNWLRNTYEKLNNQFMRRFFLRDKPDTCEMDLMHSFTKYQIHEQIESIVRKRSTASMSSFNNQAVQAPSAAKPPASPSHSTSSVSFCIEPDEIIEEKKKNKSEEKLSKVNLRILFAQKPNQFTMSRYEIPETQLDLQAVARWARLKKEAVSNNYYDKMRKRSVFDTPLVEESSGKKYQKRKISTGKDRSFGRCELVGKKEKLERQKEVELGSVEDVKFELGIEGSNRMESSDAHF